MVERNFDNALELLREIVPEEKNSIEKQSKKGIEKKQNKIKNTENEQVENGKYPKN